MRLALCQMNILWEDKKQNIDKAEQFIKSAESDIIFFPEMSFTGFSMNIGNTKEKDYSLNIVKSIAVKYNVAVGFGWTREWKDKGENVYTVVNNKGEVISEYIKLHPFSYSGEDNYFKAGNSIVAFEYNDFRIGTLICYDLRFPEVFQALSKNVDLIVVPACWPDKRSNHWKTLLKARAIENQCYIAGVNCVGDIGGIYYSGNSMIINPNGDILSFGKNKEMLVFAEIKNDVAQYRRNFPAKRDRRISLYKELI